MTKTTKGNPKDAFEMVAAPQRPAQLALDVERYEALLDDPEMTPAQKEQALQAL